MNGLTPRQRQCLDFIADWISAQGSSPSYREIGDGLGIRSKSGVHSLLHSLKERGAIMFLPRRARSITVREP